MTNDLPSAWNPNQQEHVIDTAHQIRFDVINIASVKVSAIENQAHTRMRYSIPRQSWLARQQTYILQWFQQNSISIIVIVVVVVVVAIVARGPHHHQRVSKQQRE